MTNGIEAARPRLWLAAILSLFALFAVMAPAAHAGTYTVNIGCDTTNPPKGWFTGGDLQGGSVQFGPKSFNDPATGCTLPWNPFEATPQNNGDFARHPVGGVVTPLCTPPPGQTECSVTTGHTYGAPGGPFYKGTMPAGRDLPFSNAAHITNVHYENFGAEKTGPNAVEWSAGLFVTGLRHTQSITLRGCNGSRSETAAATGFPLPNPANQPNGPTNCTNAPPRGLASLETGPIDIPMTQFGVPQTDINRFTAVIGCLRSQLFNFACRPNALVSSSVDRPQVTVEETDPPELSNVTTPSSASYINAAAPSGLGVSFDAKDLVGVHNASVSVDGAPAASLNNPNCADQQGATITTYTPCFGTAGDPGRIFNGQNVPFDTSKLADGTHTGRFVVTDSLRNSTAPIVFEFRIDRTPPSAQFTSSAGCNVKFGASDATSGVNGSRSTLQYSNDGGATYTSFASTFSGDPNAGGTLAGTIPTAGCKNGVTVRADVFDVAGNETLSGGPVLQPVPPHGYDVSIRKTADRSSYTVGDVATYSLRIQNAGPTTAPSSVVTDVLPASTTPISASSTCKVSGRFVRCDSGPLRAGGTKIYKISVRLTAAGTTVNSATVKRGPDDPDAKDKSSTSNIRVKPKPATIIRANKTVSSSHVVRGHSVVYRLTVSNRGKTTARGVRICDRLPRNTQLVRARPRVYFSRSSACHRFGTLRPGHSATLVLTLRFTMNARAGRTGNTETVTANGIRPVRSTVYLTVRRPRRRHVGLPTFTG